MDTTQKRNFRPIKQWLKKIQDYFGSDKRGWGYRALLQVGAFAGALILGSAPLPYGIYPLGIAFAGAMSIHTVFALLGLFCSAVFTVNLRAATIIATLLLGALRYCFRYFYKHREAPYPPFAEPLWGRMTSVGIACGICALYRLWLGGFRMYDIAGSLLLLAIGIGGTVLFSAAFGEVRLRYRTALQTAGRLALAAALVYCMREMLWFGIAPGACLAFFLTLYAAYGGVGSGCVAGLVCGMAFSLPTAPAYAIAGVLFGLMRRLNLPLALAWACAGGGIYLVFSADLITLYATLPDWMLAMGLLLLWRRFLPVDLPSRQNCEKILSPLREAEAQAKFQALSGALTALSETFFQLSERLRKPGIYAVRKMCNDTLRDICDHCAHQKDCKAGAICQRLQTVDALAGQMFLSGQTETADAPAVLTEHCLYLHDVMDRVNEAYGRLLQTAVEGNRTEIFASDYASLSKLLRHAIQTSEEEYAIDYEKTHDAYLQAQKMGFGAKDLAVCGRRRLQVCAVGIDEARATPKELQERMEKVLGVPLTAPAFEVRGEGELMMRMTRRAVLSAQASGAGVPKAGEEVCGDVVTSFQGEDGLFYTLISDGMGSGQDAAVSAGICRVFLEKMLLAGNSRSVALEMLNDLIRNKNTENFATVDLLEVDLWCKEARFLKSGAAPSFVLRGGNLFKIAANTMPVGITKSLHAEEIRFALEDGDVILMFSDGVAQSFEDSLWLLGVVTCEWEDDLDVMTKKILSRAKLQNGDSDDMSVGLIRISAA